MAHEPERAHDDLGGSRQVLLAPLPTSVIH
jgi:hypothetical protein